MKSRLMVLHVVAFILLSWTAAAQFSAPAIADIPNDLSAQVREQLSRTRVSLVQTKAVLLSKLATHNSQCRSVPADSSAAQTCRGELDELKSAFAQYAEAVRKFNDEVAAASPATPSSGLDFIESKSGTDSGGISESAYFYALQTRTLEPTSEGGHPIDPLLAPIGSHGLVGGTTWTYGFKRPHVKCEKQCQDDIKKSLDSQLVLFCSSQSDKQKCIRDGLPFSPDMYDMVVSMGSSHSAIEDLATRVLFDGATFGEFSRQNKEIFASLKGRQFDTLDCHSNGAMLCLAALRSGDTKAKVVRLFGPQINPEAAKRWQELAKDPNNPMTLEIYINNGDPIPAISWKQPTPQTSVGKVLTAVWLTNPLTGPATFSDALFNTYLDSKQGVMDATLTKYGFVVMRSDCDHIPNLECHSMLRYEKSLPKQPLK